MKDWLGILIFVGIAIANIMLEKNRQKKKKDARTVSSAPPLPTSGSCSVPGNAARPVRREAPVIKEPTLQEALQRLFEASQAKPAAASPPPLAKKVEAVMESPPPRPVTPSVNKSASVKAPVPVTTAAPAQTATLEQPATVVNRNSENWLSKANVRSKSALRRAVIMSEILAKPKALQ